MKAPHTIVRPKYIPASVGAKAAKQGFPSAMRFCHRLMQSGNTSAITATSRTKARHRRSRRDRKYCTGTCAFRRGRPLGQAIAATASINSEMPTYFTVCSTSGSWSANPTSQSKLVTAIIEYFTAGIAVSLRKNFSMTLHSAAPRPRGNRLLHCNIIYCNAKWQIELRH